ncbi:hypothetical protein OUZ56_027323 [Daphnia magna]|uniref:Uncharacterized protein n=1 Tax=Daphnia magna TaxID=35525 RepID=A0ABQ9ZQT7_9CRUS|nr:hypothetical protein OUZ56_027323 [Daphnia magna]
MLIFNRDLNPRSLDPYVNVLPQSYNTCKKFIQNSKLPTSGLELHQRKFNRTLEFSLQQLHINGHLSSVKGPILKGKITTSKVAVNQGRGRHCLN